MGRTAFGVRGMQLRDGDEVVAMEVVTDDATLLTVCEKGYGKRTAVSEYRRQSRGGIGLKNLQASERNGFVVGLACVSDGHELLLVTEQGQIIRMRVADLRPIGRDTQGVRLMDLAEGDRIVSIATLAEPEVVAGDDTIAVEPGTPTDGEPSEGEPSDGAAGEPEPGESE
jgi:DNA gyrase subunit A